MPYGDYYCSLRPMHPVSWSAVILCSHRGSPTRTLSVFGLHQDSAAHEVGEFRWSVKILPQQVLCDWLTCRRIDCGNLKQKYWGFILSHETDPLAVVAVTIEHCQRGQKRALMHPAQLRCAQMNFQRAVVWHGLSHVLCEGLCIFTIFEVQGPWRHHKEYNQLATVYLWSEFILQRIPESLNVLLVVFHPIAGGPRLEDWPVPTDEVLPLSHWPMSEKKLHWYV